MKLQSVARLYLVCQIHNGKSDLFWHNNWTGLRPLIDFLEPNGPRVSSIGTFHTVSQVVTLGAWNIPRGHHPILLLWACFLLFIFILLCLTQMYFYGGTLRHLLRSFSLC